MEKKKKLANIDTILIVAIFVILAVYFIFAPSGGEAAADVVLSKFSLLHNNEIASIELWIENMGNNKAVNISVYVRIRNETGHILFDGNPDLTCYSLRPNESCSTVFFINISNSSKLYSTIEIQWNGGRNSYLVEREI